MSADTVSQRGEEIERKCAVCYSRRARAETLDKVLCIDGEFAMVYDIPAEVCVDCGEEMISDEDIEWVRLMLRGECRKTAKWITLKAYNFPE